MMVASLFRNYLLAERIMRSLRRTPVSYPKIPSTSQHPLWYNFFSFSCDQNDNQSQIIVTFLEGKHGIMH